MLTAHFSIKKTQKNIKGEERRLVGKFFFFKVYTRWHSYSLSVSQLRVLFFFECMSDEGELRTVVDR